MSNAEKEVFKITQGDKEIELAVKKPGPAEGRESQSAYNRAFAQALESGGLLRARVESYMRSQGLWDDAKEEQQRQFVTKLADMDLRLKKGGIKLSEARSVALSMRVLRSQFRELLAERNRLDVNTVEGQAENARFNSLVSQCLVYNDTGERYYKSLDDYLSHANDTEAFKAASLLGQMIFKLDKNYEASLPENQFLRRFKFIDEDLRLVNKDGDLVDEDGRLIDKDGRFIAYVRDAKGNIVLDDKGQKKTIFVDRDGREVDAEGNYVVQEEPFLNDDGTVYVEDTTTTAPTTPSGEDK